MNILNHGTFADSEHNNRPVCAECVYAAYPSAWLEGEDEQNEVYANLQDRRSYSLLPQEEQKECWSCCQMIEEYEAQEEWDAAH